MPQGGAERRCSQHPATGQAFLSRPQDGKASLHLRAHTLREGDCPELSSGPPRGYAMICELRDSTVTPQIIYLDPPFPALAASVSTAIAKHPEDLMGLAVTGCGWLAPHPLVTGVSWTVRS